VKSPLSQNIQRIVSETKAHKDAFAVPELIALFREELEKHKRATGDLAAATVLFVDKAVQALAASPIYSPALVREFYRRVLEAALEAGVPKEALLEDLLFQSLLRPIEAEGAKRRRQKDSRGRVLRAALDEFSEKGFHSTTIDSIAERAGMDKGTVYTHFRTKEELFNALKEDKMSELLELARIEVAEETDVLLILERIIRGYLGFFEQNSAFFKVIIQEQKDFGREFSEKFINALIHAFPGLKRACWKASRAGSLKQMNYFTVFYGIVGFLNGVIQKWLHEGGHGSLVTEADTVKEVLFYGFAAPPDRVKGTNSLKVIS